MEQFYTVLHQIGIFVLLIALGYLIVKIDILDEASLGRISRLIVKVLLPCYIFYNTAEGATRAGLASALLVIPLSIGYFLVLFFASELLKRLFRLNGNRARVFRALSMFGNVGFVGIPLLVELYPDTSLIYISLFTIFDQGLFWTYGLANTKPVTEEKIRFHIGDLKKLLSPALIAIVLAIILVLLDRHLPSSITATSLKLGNASMPLSLLYIGGMLSMTDVRKVLRCGELYAEIGLKMLLIPVLIYAALRIFGVVSDMAGTMAFLAGLPAVNMVPMLAKLHGSDSEYAVCAVMMTTLASLVTLPLISLAVTVIG